MISFGCVIFGFVCFWVLVHSGTNSRLGNNMDEVAKFAVLSPCLIAIVLAVAGLR